MAIENVSKLEAATRQLHHAIHLNLEDGDVLCAHTLASAAHGILSDLRTRAQRRIPHPRGTDAAGSRAIVRGMVKEARNFLKHADTDPDRTLPFNPDWTDFVLYEAIGMHLDLTQRFDRKNMVFLLWTTMKYPTVRLLDDLLGAQVDQLRQLLPEAGGAIGWKGKFAAMLNGQAPT